MRIIAGEARGRKLKPVPEEGTRPTSDRVKESIFNILQFHLEGRRVLDLFAGSGQLGVEALSRGARECVFVEQSGAAADVIRENARFFAGRFEVRVAEVLRWLESAAGTFDIVLLDPPYQSQLAKKTLQILFRRDMVSPGGFILCECARETEPPEAHTGYALQKTYPYGSKQLLLYARQTEGTQ
ncbi:MAG: 16S rRNA (guanine(966)-N(2))-methyltransferase RsmD [Oscillospiraceae bacterium]|jgi:16S rRNA (guanine(966)-N(2))-methyltransferase RsmD|nr:16S rRNA (guanine(966)-N(2))-methyltransferase RsmD [Oscillospiraceae bacterium]